MKIATKGNERYSKLNKRTIDLFGRREVQSSEFENAVRRFMQKVSTTVHSATSTGRLLVPVGPKSGFLQPSTGAEDSTEHQVGTTY